MALTAAAKPTEIDWPLLPLGFETLIDRSADSALMAEVSVASRVTLPRVLVTWAPSSRAAWTVLVIWLLAQLAAMATPVPLLLSLTPRPLALAVTGTPVTGAKEASASTV